MPENYQQLRMPFNNGPKVEPDHPPTPATAWEQDAAKRALDELFNLTFQYETSQA
jgi:hypothetical protein